jgi:hypothetical protein
MGLPMDRFLNLVYFYATEDAEEKDRTKFDLRLNLPDERARRKMSEGVIDESSPWSKKNEERALGGLVAALTGAPK